MAQIWAPHVIDNVKNSDLDLYLQFSTSACVPGGGCHVDEALQVLYESKGDIKRATQHLLAIQLNCKSIWTLEEIKAFEKLVILHRKNFHLISQDLNTKTVKECVLFYYIWKKKKLSTINHHHNHYQQQQQHQQNHLQQKQQQQHPLQHQSQPQQHLHLPLPHLHQNGQISITSPDTLAKPDEFPCKVCGRIFVKIKSRSAHMKRHKNEQ